MPGAFEYVSADVSITLTGLFSEWVNLFYSSYLRIGAVMLSYYEQIQIILLFCHEKLHLFFIALALNFDACPVDLALRAYSIRCIKISACMH